MPGHARQQSAVSCAKMAEPIDLPFRLWTQVGLGKHKFNPVRQVAPRCPHGMAQWRNLENPILPSVGGADTALCQITVTT